MLALLISLRIVERRSLGVANKYIPSIQGRLVCMQIDDDRMG
jgi:hypothetical protein